jgi:hypothetical protein
MFCTSLRSRRCSTRRRKAAASSSVRSRSPSPLGAAESLIRVHDSGRPEAASWIGPGRRRGVRRALARLAVVALVAGAAGCGPSADRLSPGASGDRPAVRPTPSASLTISYRDGEGDSRRATLTCSPGADRVTGYLRLSQAPELCRRLGELTGLLTAEPERGRVCAQVYGGPATARIQGRLEGRRVDRRLARTDACQIDDWRRAGPLLPDV